MSFRPSARDRLHADQGSLDVSACFIAARNSGSSAASIVICVKKTMSLRQLREPLHQLEALARASPCSSRAALGSCAPRGHAQIFERHRIEVVVGERDEPEAPAPQLHDLLDHRCRRCAGAAAGHRSATPSRTSSASGSRERSAPTPTYSDPAAADPSGPAGTILASTRPPSYTRCGCPPTQSAMTFAPDHARRRP